jgi:hypothetical protein
LDAWFKLQNSEIGAKTSSKNTLDKLVTISSNQFPEVSEVSPSGHGGHGGPGPAFRWWSSSFNAWI